MNYKNNKTEQIGVRVTPEVKNEIDIIINILNEIKPKDHPKYSYSYAFEFLIDYYRNHPNFKLKIKEQKIIEQIENLETQKSFIDVKTNMLNNELHDIQNELNHKPLEDYEEQEILLTKPLKEAMNSIKTNYKQREYVNIIDIPNEMWESVANTFKVNKHDLIKVVKQDFKNW